MADIKTNTEVDWNDFGYDDDDYEDEIQDNKTNTTPIPTTTPTANQRVDITKDTELIKQER